jgi:hypothetical protein
MGIRGLQAEMWPRIQQPLSQTKDAALWEPTFTGNVIGLVPIGCPSSRWPWGAFPPPAWLAASSCGAHLLVEQEGVSVGQAWLETPQVKQEHRECITAQDILVIESELQDILGTGRQRSAPWTSPLPSTAPPLLVHTFTAPWIL